MSKDLKSSFLKSPKKQSSNNLKATDDSKDKKSIQKQRFSTEFFIHEQDGTISINLKRLTIVFVVLI